MQVFVIGSPLETARALDGKRLAKQIIEVEQLFSTLDGKSKAWANHPVVRMYSQKEGRAYLRRYLRILKAYRESSGKVGIMLKAYNWLTHLLRPYFHSEEYYDQMKRRLYTKDPQHYAQWAELGTSESNWYWSHEEKQWIFYKNKKRTYEAY